ncbi:MAG TPA: DNA polymerase, partial [Candidatus Eremiobacteraeota bacterium]|nr:DNA polymerase [Candidatus Eremiobacteraeota bacterium]
KRHLNRISDRNMNIRKGEERIAVNAPIQGSAADIIKLAMIQIDREIDDRKLKTGMVLQVHDELIFDIFPGEFDTVCRIVKTHMEKACKLGVPLIVEFKKGIDWYHMESFQVL